MAGAVTQVAGRSIELDDATARISEARRAHIQAIQESARARAEVDRAPAADVRAVRETETRRPAVEVAADRPSQRGGGDAAMGRSPLSSHVRDLMTSGEPEPPSSSGDEMRMIRDLLATIRELERQPPNAG